VSEPAVTAHEGEYVPLGDAARRLSVSHSTLISAIRRGELRGFRFGERGNWRLEAESLERLIEERSRP